MRFAINYFIQLPVLGSCYCCQIALCLSLSLSHFWRIIRIPSPLRRFISFTHPSRFQFVDPRFDFRFFFSQTKRKPRELKTERKFSAFHFIDINSFIYFISFRRIGTSLLFFLLELFQSCKNARSHLFSIEIFNPRVDHRFDVYLNLI